MLKQSSSDSWKQHRVTAEEAFNIASPADYCRLSNEEILFFIYKRISSNSKERSFHAAFPNVWFRPEVVKILEEDGFTIAEDTYKAKYGDISKDYRRISWAK